MGRGATGREGKEGGLECLDGMGLQFFLTLFTRATPGTPASIYILLYILYPKQPSGQRCIKIDDKFVD